MIGKELVQNDGVGGGPDVLRRAHRRLRKCFKNTGSVEVWVWEQGWRGKVEKLC